uniref:F-box/kelch-repeat protein At3g06240-like n=1 Tax=Erigeron canadensis TaxID=72917 RepID=UPI001CB9C0CC|nr:F-box/kelch-repeat protein At3g06240-like [Erigeron canadensis]
MIVDNPDYDYSHSSVYFNGFLHWIIKKKNGSNVIVAFSLADECLSEVPSPNCGNHTDIMSSDFCQLVVLGGKLAIYSEQNIDLWLMKEYGVNESWTNISLDVFWNHELCIRDSMIFYDNGKIRVASGKTKQMLIYDFEKGKFSNDAYVWRWKFHLFGSYVESLVSPKRQNISSTANTRKLRLRWQSLEITQETKKVTKIMRIEKC